MEEGQLRVRLLRDVVIGGLRVARGSMVTMSFDQAQTWREMGLCAILAGPAGTGRMTLSTAIVETATIEAPEVRADNGCR